MVKSRIYDRIDKKVAVLNDSTFPLYILTGEKNILIDSGPTARAPEFSEKISLILREITGDKQARIHTLLLTHSHWDHTGGAHILQQRYGFDVMASRHTVHLLNKPGVIRAIDGMNQNFKKMIPDRSGTCFAGLKKLSSIRSGESIRLDKNSRIDILETPGHTRCSIAFLLLPERILFPGDAAGLMEPDGTLRPLFFSSYPEYEHSLRSLLRQEARILALPHNRPVCGADRVKKYLEDSLLKAEEVREAILKHLEQGHDTRQTLEWIVDREYSDISFMGPRDILVSSLESMVKSVVQGMPDMETG